ncbi:primosomal protein N' [soil metagenome]
MDAVSGEVDEQFDGPLCADVAIDAGSYAHGKSVYTYLVPLQLESRLGVGQLVWVPLRRKVDIGLVVRLHRVPPAVPLKPLRSLVRPAHRLNEQELDIARWIARETVSTLYAAASPFFPPGVEHASTEIYELVDPDSPAAEDLTSGQRRVFELLWERGALSRQQISRAMKSNPVSSLRALEEAGVVERTLEVEDKQPNKRTKRFVRLVTFDLDAVARSPRQRQALEWLEQRRTFLGTEGEVTPVRELTKQEGITAAIVAALEAKGLVEVTDRETGEHPTPTDAASPPVLTNAQATAWRFIEDALEKGIDQPILLYGVTGSGKTEMYLRAAGWCIRFGKSAIVLLPEIALATQIVRRFEERFPGQVAILHSAQPKSERFAAWSAIARGEKSIVIGPRSALFSPARNPGCIVIDEEQDPAFKQDSEPRYHARSLAEYMARQRRVPLILGSATPAIETAYRATRDEIGRLDLPERVLFDAGGVDTVLDRSSSALPKVTIVDMRAEARETGSALISRTLRQSVHTSLERGEQSIVLLNRRGMSTIVLCRSCGRSVDCPHCDIPLVFHRDRDRLVCHRCNYQIPPSRVCGECGGTLDYFGAGTQRIEQEFNRLEPGARTLRIDRDSIKELGGFENAIQRVERGEADIVVGTQIVAKGLDFPRVTTVGVVQADSALHLPDYRSAERTFQLVAQVAGRAGRRTARGIVVVQSYTPDHYAITSAAAHSYEDFYADEIAFRRQFRYPPFSRMARFLYRAASEQACRSEAEALALALAEHAASRSVEADLLGPAPAFAARIRGDYQWQVVLRAPVDSFDRLLDELPVRPGWLVDVDPSQMI